MGLFGVGWGWLCVVGCVYAYAYRLFWGGWVGFVEVVLDVLLCESVCFGEGGEEVVYVLFVEEVDVLGCVGEEEVESLCVFFWLHGCIVACGLPSWWGGGDYFFVVTTICGGVVGIKCVGFLLERVNGVSSLRAGSLPLLVASGGGSERRVLTGVSGGRGFFVFGNICCGWLL